MRYDDEGEFWNTLVNTVAGAISGGLTAALSGENIWDGALSGAATGFMEGLVTDIVIVCCTNPVTAFATLVVSSGVINGFSTYCSQYYSGEDINVRDIVYSSISSMIVTAADFGINPITTFGKPQVQGNLKDFAIEMGLSEGGNMYSDTFLYTWTQGDKYVYRNQSHTNLFDF